MIELKSVSKTFGDGEQAVYALKNINLCVPKGRIYGVIGASGAGKSTLIRCVNMLEAPTSGSVVVAGQTLTELNRSALNKARQHIGMIFQHFNLLSNRNVFDNIALPLELAGHPPKYIKQRVNELIALVGLVGREQAYPAQLSGGQKQRVAIARALAPKPQVLLCDEATSALDPATTKQILDLLADINQQLGITILLITHEMQVVKQICTDVAIIDAGELVEAGTVGSIFAKPKTAQAKRFIAATQHDELPKALASELSDNGEALAVRITFSGSAHDTEQLYQLAAEHQVAVRLYQSDLDYVDGACFGHVIAALKGEQPEVICAAINGAKVEVLGRV
ncbi:methionine ABC transporter ATP-binding protein [Salinibius halmophilus]|uniref:methionine ABC transporter ATP-binding protein n=1 Tax=Salinibius halmophilus TaxID=1853216 RepID=UPI000E668F52|nr:ATP-binding cassette domain-containing protein [Salinibius halmophilus]